MPSQLTAEEKKVLLSIARQSMTDAVYGRAKAPLVIEDLSPSLKENGASFVTLTRNGRLRGCIGTLEAYQPLALDVQTRAAQAATEDYRFSPVTPQELDKINIEISRLTPPIPLHYTRPEELPKLLHPHRDGVILQSGFSRATYLPQVWDQIPDPADFLSELCLKMGKPAYLWQREMLNVSIYQVEEFKE